MRVALLSNWLPNTQSFLGKNAKPCSSWSFKSLAMVFIKFFSTSTSDRPVMVWSQMGRKRFSFPSLEGASEAEMKYWRIYIHNVSLCKSQGFHTKDLMSRVSEPDLIWGGRKNKRSSQKEKGLKNKQKQELVFKDWILKHYKIKIQLGENKLKDMTNIFGGYPQSPWYSKRAGDI